MRILKCTDRLFMVGHDTLFHERQFMRDSVSKERVRNAGEHTGWGKATRFKGMGAR